MYAADRSMAAEAPDSVPAQALVRGLYFLSPEAFISTCVA